MHGKSRQRFAFGAAVSALVVLVQIITVWGDDGGQHIMEYDGNCPEACLLDIYRPVCGIKSDGESEKTFTTKCDWELHNCNNADQAYPKARMGACS